jgi:hypothetical protein
MEWSREDVVVIAEPPRISGAVHAVSTPTAKGPLDVGTVEMAIDGKVVTGTGFASNTFPAVRVFNRDFVERSVFETPGHELPPV